MMLRRLKADVHAIHTSCLCGSYMLDMTDTAQATNYHMIARCWGGRHSRHGVKREFAERLCTEKAVSQLNTPGLCDIRYDQRPCFATSTARAMFVRIAGLTIHAACCPLRFVILS